jgi:hypothetical protein
MNNKFIMIIRIKERRYYISSVAETSCREITPQDVLDNLTQLGELANLESIRTLETLDLLEERLQMTLKHVQGLIKKSSGVAEQNSENPDELVPVAQLNFVENSQQQVLAEIQARRALIPDFIEPKFEPRVTKQELETKYFRAK